MTTPTDVCLLCRIERRYSGNPASCGPGNFKALGCFLAGSPTSTIGDPVASEIPEVQTGDSDLTTLRDALVHIRHEGPPSDVPVPGCPGCEAAAAFDRLVALLEARNEQNPGADKVGSESAKIASLVDLGNAAYAAAHRASSAEIAAVLHESLGEDFFEREVQ